MAIKEVKVVDTSQTPKDHNDKAHNDNIRKRLDNLYSKQELPTHASISDVESMKARIRELEAKLLEFSSSTIAGSPKNINSEMDSQYSNEIANASVTREKKKNFLTNLLRTPIFGDLSKNRIASLQHKILLGLMSTSILALLILFLTLSATSTATGFIIVGSSIPLYSVAFAWLYQGRLQLVSWLLVAIFYAVIVTTQLTGTFSPTTVILVTIVIAMAGILLKPFQVIAVTTLTTITSVFFAATNSEIPPTQTTIIFMAVLFTLEGLLLTFGAGAIEQSFVDVDNSTKALVNSNKQLQDLTQNLEQHVANRTHDMELAAEVGQSITQRVGNLSELLSQSVELIRSKFFLYYTQIYIVDPSGRSLVLRAGTGTAGDELMQRGHRLAISSASLNGRAALERRALIVDDTQQNSSFLPNRLLPLTRSELAIPLIVNTKVVGVLDIQNEKPGTFSEVNLPAYQVLAGQLAIAIQNAALFKDAEESRLVLEEQSRRLTRAGWQNFMNAVDRHESIGYVFNQDEVIPLVESQSPSMENSLVVPIEVTGANVGEVQLVDKADRIWTAEEKEIVQSAVSRVGQHIENLRLLAEADKYRQEAEQVSRRLTREGWGTYLQTRSEIVSGYSYNLNEIKPLNGTVESDKALTKPITVRDETIGELLINADNIDQDEVNEIFSAVATQLSDHIESLRLLEQNEKRAYELATVATVSTTASTVLDPDKLLQAVVDLTKERFNMYHAHIYLADESWNTLLLSTGAGEVGRSMVEKGHAIEMDSEKSLVARAARERKAVIVNDVRSEAGFLRNPMLPETRAEIAVPMISGEKVLGVFDVQSQTAGQFTEEDASIFTTLATQVAVALQNARLYVEQSATVTQLRELDRLKSSFLANMSHELRTPLNSILGFADVMLEELDGPLTENMTNDLGLIQKNGQHLLHLINDVLDMAKIESGKMNLNVEKFVLHHVIDEVTNITSSLANEKTLSIIIEPDSDHDVEINADKIRLRQVMINLVNNAMKFTEKGSISIRALRENNHVLVSIKDTGIGIPEDHLESIFQEFTQVDTTTTRKAGGTGLGLPISRRLIEMHSGRLWAESTGVNGEGTTFYVELPIEANINETSNVAVK